MLNRSILCVGCSLIGALVAGTGASRALASGSVYAFTVNAPSSGLVYSFASAAPFAGTMIGANDPLQPASVRELLEAGRDILALEAACLDEQRWDEWLALFAADCEYWVPTWVTEERLAEDPQSQLSQIYYSSRAGLGYVQLPADFLPLRGSEIRAGPAAQGPCRCVRSRMMPYV